MNKKEQKVFLQAMEAIMEQKNITRDQLKEALVFVFEKTFGRDYSLLTPEQREVSSEIEDGIVEVIIDLEKFVFEIKRKWIINNEQISLENTLKQIPTTSAIIPDEQKDKLKDGDQYYEEIDLSEISNFKRQQIQQLLIQKTKETEKEKVYTRFQKLIGTIINAKVFRVDDNYILLSYNDESVFLPRKETSPTDEYIVGKYIKVLVMDVNKTSKDSQIVASRRRPEFVERIIEQEIEDVASGLVKIEKISREAGFKTKIAVSSSNPSIDPVGSIIGVKAAKIKSVIQELNREIIDVVEYSPIEETLLGNLFHPAKLKGVYISPDKTHAAILVEDKEFLQAIGKKGINVKLVAQIMGYKIDVVTDSTKEKFDIEFKPYVKESSRRGGSKNQNDFKLEIKSIEEIIEDGNRLEELAIDFDDLDEQ